MRPMQTSALLALAMLGSGCTDLFGPRGDCAGVGYPGVELHVVAEDTGADLDRIAFVEVAALQAPFDSAQGPLVTQPPDHLSPTWPTDRQPGQYRVIVTAPGYLPWQQDVPVRRRNRCGEILTTRLTVRLAPQP